MSCHYPALNSGPPTLLLDLALHLTSVVVCSRCGTPILHEPDAISGVVLEAEVGAFTVGGYGYLELESFQYCGLLTEWQTPGNFQAFPGPEEKQEEKSTMMLLVTGKNIMCFVQAKKFHDPCLRLTSSINVFCPGAKTRRSLCTFKKRRFVSSAKYVSYSTGDSPAGEQQHCDGNSCEVRASEWAMTATRLVAILIYYRTKF